MTANDLPAGLLQATPHPTRRPLLVGITTVDDHRVIHVHGELDIGAGDVVHGACVVDDATDVLVDLRQLTFMDCGGYRGLVAARLELEDRGGSLQIERARGQPARFLSLVGVSLNLK